MVAIRVIIIVVATVTKVVRTVIDEEYSIRSSSFHMRQVSHHNLTKPNKTKQNKTNTRINFTRINFCSGNQENRLKKKLDIQLSR
jgi:tRNA G37 N-methylase TrmD